MWFIAVLGLLAAADASSYLFKRALIELDPTNMMVFTEQFHTTLMHIIATEWNATEPMVNRLRTEMPKCEQLLNERKTTCKSCAKNKCSPSVGEVIEGTIIGIGREIGDFFDDVGHGFVSWEGWDDMRNFFSTIGKNFVGWEGWRDMGDFFENIGKGFVNWSGWKDMGKFFENFGKGFLDLGKDIGKGLGDIGKDIGSFFSGLFKRSIDYGLYRREIPSEVRQCMERCDSCRPFLGPPEQMVSSVCGDELVVLNRTVQYIVHNLELLYKRMAVDKQPVVTTLRYDPATMVPAELAFRPVSLTAYFEDGVRDYESEVPYKFMELAKTAALMAREYFEKFVRRT